MIVVVALQAAQTVAPLFLPTLNADIIDRGVATGDTGYIWKHGGVMLFVSMAQICFAICAAFTRPKPLLRRAASPSRTCRSATGATRR